MAAHTDYATTERRTWLRNNCRDIGVHLTMSHWEFVTAIVGIGLFVAIILGAYVHEVLGAA